MKERVPTNFTNIAGKHLCWGRFLLTTLLIKGFNTFFFLMKFEKFLRSPILKIICKRLPLKIEIVLPRFVFFGYSTVKKDYTEGLLLLT